MATAVTADINLRITVAVITAAHSAASAEAMVMVVASEMAIMALGTAAGISVTLEVATVEAVMAEVALAEVAMAAEVTATDREAANTLDGRLRAPVLAIADVVAPALQERRRIPFSGRKVIIAVSHSES